MNISYRWLRDLAPGLREEPEALAERLGMLGAPVEDLVRMGAGLEDVVVARVLRAEPHPNADRLSLCQVDTGSDTPVQVVCGAPVIEEGGLYPFAPVGATLPGGLQLRRARIRGEYSNGMLCSEKELELGADRAGIMRLDDTHAVGTPLLQALGLDDVRFVLEVTPNRPDLLSHAGVARELAPDGHHGLELPPFPPPGSEERTDAEVPPLSLKREGVVSVVAGARVSLEDPAGCPRYLAAVIRGVEVGPSPSWLAARLRAIGQRSINNVVDATNYVLHELGQPLHAFDLDRLAGPAICVRRARAGERITTLDHVDRELTPDMLVIADARVPVAVAGVMGGAGSEVGPETRNLLIECACFDPRSVRATARALSLSTDASYRFERGVDMEGMSRALHRVVELIQAVASGEVDHIAVDLYPEPGPRPVVPLRVDRVARVLGEDLSADEVVALLQHIGFELQDHREDGVLSFAVPGFRRHDVTREIDLIEEVARRYGYDRLGESLRPYRPNTVPEEPLSGLEDRIRDFLVGVGLLEAQSVSMVPATAGEVPLLRPLSAEEGYLRSSLLHGLIRALGLNLARGVRDVRLFQLGTTFHAAGVGQQPEEETRVAVCLSGRRAPRHWSEDVPDWDVWDVRGLAEELAGLLGAGTGQVVPLGDPAEAGSLVLPGRYRPGTLLGIVIDGELRGVAGQVDPAALDAPAWAAPAFALEAQLTPEMARRPRPSLAPLPTQPPSDRDLALLVPRDVPAATVATMIRAAAGPLLESLELFDLYTGPGVPSGSRSLAYRLVFRHRERTLRDAEVDAAVDQVLATLEAEHGVKRRG
jgi:phenylalanyl-tRNA synthetase beta chain